MQQNKFEKDRRKNKLRLMGWFKQNTDNERESLAEKFLEDIVDERVHDTHRSLCESSTGTDMHNTTAVNTT
jgi:hypothetical protein